MLTVQLKGRVQLYDSVGLPCQVIFTVPLNNTFVYSSIRSNYFKDGLTHFAGKMKDLFEIWLVERLKIKCCLCLHTQLASRLRNVHYF